MFNVGGGELLVIMLIALIVLGPQRLPDAARKVGKAMGELRRISSGFQQEMKQAFEVDDTPPPRRGPAPLAAAVAEADRDPTQRGTEAAGGGDGGPGVAPAVADALDEIVSSHEPARPAEAPRPPAGDGAAGVPDDGLGDERAAS